MGTEILNPLTYCIHLRHPPEISKVIFILTDGSVSNTQAIIEKVKFNKEICKVFTFGIGAGSSKELVREVAIAGRGSYQFVDDT